MPDHTFDGSGPHTYPSSKDLAGISVGTVEPGEIRDTDGPLDHLWRETTDEDRVSLAARKAAAEQAGVQAGQALAGVDDAIGQLGQPVAAAAEGGTSPPPAGQPAPPAVLPQPAPSASSDQQEG